MYPYISLFFLAVQGLRCGTRDLHCLMQNLRCLMRNLRCGMRDLQLRQVGSSSLSRDGTRAPCIGSTEFQPLDHTGKSPYILTYMIKLAFQISRPFSKGLGQQVNHLEKTKQTKISTPYTLIPSRWITDVSVTDGMLEALEESMKNYFPLWNMAKLCPEKSGTKKG